jgi:hypothetical protein
MSELCRGLTSTPEWASWLGGAAVRLLFGTFR